MTRRRDGDGREKGRRGRSTWAKCPWGIEDLTRVSSALFSTSIYAFYGLNFLKDVQTTKLNAQLDIKERPSPFSPSLNIYIYVYNGRAPDFSRALFRLNASLSRNDALNVKWSWVTFIYAAERKEHLSNRARDTIVSNFAYVKLMTGRLCMTIFLSLTYLIYTYCIYYYNYVYTTCICNYRF